jgi:acyl carrier protein
MTSDQLTVETTVKQVIADYKKIKPSDIHVEALLNEDLNIDSLGRLEIAFQIQNQFKVEIPDEDLPNIRTVSDVIAYIQDHK